MIIRGVLEMLDLKEATQICTCDQKHDSEGLLGAFFVAAHTIEGENEFKNLSADSDHEIEITIKIVKPSSQKPAHQSRLQRLH